MGEAFTGRISVTMHVDIVDNVPSQMVVDGMPKDTSASITICGLLYLLVLRKALGIEKEEEKKIIGVNIFPRIQ